ncbi:MAG: MFS transporter [Clostridium sp.]
MKNLKIFILAFGVFSIINAEMGVVGILPLISENYQVSISTAGLLVSMFALAVAFAGPTMPLFLSKMNRKYAMLLVLGLFTICNFISAFATSFSVLLIVRILPAFFQPVYVSLAFSVAASSVSKEDVPKSASKVMMGVSAGMVLGVPIVSYIANSTNLVIAMLFFAMVNAIAFIATIFLFPSMPVEHQMTYGEQLSVLKKSKTWISIIGVMLLNGSVFGVYSYISEYLTQVTEIPSQMISVILFVYGIANIIGNIIAGRLLSVKPLKFVAIIPFCLGFLYILQLFFGQFTLVSSILILVWGIIAGCIGNINQYWLSTAVPKAPDFANGLFLAATNLGTTIGATIGGGIITTLGVSSIFLSGIVLLIGSIIFILIRIKNENSQQKSVCY